MLAVTDTRIVTPSGVLEQGTLLCQGERITQIGPADEVTVPSNCERIDGRGRTLLPGFIDVHIHGGGGADTMDADPDALRAICRTHARHGTTGLLLTTMTQSREKIMAALSAAHSATVPGFCPDGAQPLGIHLEGPYLSPKRAGAQPVQWVRDYDAEEFSGWLEASGRAIRLMTAAPERPGAQVLFEAAREAGIVVSLGHTDATTEETKSGLAWGAAHGTHLFNQMRPLHHREPGPIGVLLSDDRARVEIIADGHHVAPEVVRLIVRAKGTHHVILVTDAMAGAGAGPGTYDLGGNEVTVAGGKALLADGTLAGSVLTMNQAVANVRAWANLDWPDLARLSSTNAADQMGWPHKGRLAPSTDADLVLVDDDLTVHATIVAGRCIYRR